MGRSPCCEKIGLKKGPWTPEEDQKLLAYIEEHGHGCWRSLPSKAGLQRCGKSCRLRWTNYLRPDIKRGKFSVQEEQTIIQLHALLGNRWSAIASHLPKRTDNEIKNFWNTHLKKRLAKMGIDPVTHKPRCDALSPADSHVAKASASLSHMAQWESARLEAEARLVREAKLLCFASSSAVSLGASSVSSAAAAASPFQLQVLGSDSSSSHVDLHNESAASSAPAPPPCFDVLRAWQDIWRRGSTRGRGEGQSSRDGKIDLESPTSTLTFSEAVIPEGAMGLGSQHNSSSIAHRCGEGDVEGEEEVDWKCFPKPMQLFFGSRERTTDGFAAATFPVDSSPLFGTDSVASWLHESVKIGSGSTAASTIAHFGDGFTEMLLNNADEHSSPEDAGGCTHELADAGKPNSENEESRSYWNGIFNLVTSSSASNSSDCVLV